MNKIIFIVYAKKDKKGITTIIHETKENPALHKKFKNQVHNMITKKVTNK